MRGMFFLGDPKGNYPGWEAGLYRLFKLLYPAKVWHRMTTPSPLVMGRGYVPERDTAVVAQMLYQAQL